MKLTACLYKHSHRFLFRMLWKHNKSRMNQSFLNKPLYLERTGAHVIPSSEVLAKNEPVFPEWTPSVPDDIQFKPIPTITDDPDYHEQFAYEFSPNSQLVKGEKQALILTKSQVFDGLPPSVRKLVGAVTIPNQDILMQKIIMQSHKWDPTKEKLPRRYNPEIPIWLFKAESGIPNLKIATLTLQNILKLCNSLIGKYPSILDSRRSVTNVQLSTYFHYLDGKHISIKGNIDATILSSHQLEPFAGKETLDQSVSHTFPDIFPFSPTVDFGKQHVWRYENVIGFREGFKFLHPQTLFLCYDDKWDTSQLNAKALMFSFGYAIGIAKNIYGNDVKVLPKPISIQCVLTNGINFTFACFQLNNIDFNNPEKNFVWFDSDNALFNKILPKRAMLRHTKYEDYDPEVLKKILAFYVNGANINALSE